MKKFLLLTLAVAGIFALTGCQSKPKEDEVSIDTEKALEEIAAMANAEMTESPNAQEGQPAPSAALTPAPVTAVGAMSTTEKPTTEQIQQALQGAGLYSGKIDGDLGPRTKKAIRDFQEQNGLVVDGKVGPKTWQKMVPYLNPAPAAMDPSGVSN